MFSKQEASRLRQEFWTAFGQYMSPVVSAEGLKINWINYKTGIKDISIRMDADNRSACISLEFTHKDALIRQIYFEQLEQLRSLFAQFVKEEWTWEKEASNSHGKSISRVVKHSESLSIYRKQDWPELISFFKPRIIALDAFWNEVKFGFELLG